VKAKKAAWLNNIKHDLKIHVTGDNYAAGTKISPHSNLKTPGGLYYVDQGRIETVRDVGGGFKADSVYKIHQVNVCDDMWCDGKWESVRREVMSCSMENVD
jgi:hypothetical protein